MNCKPGGALWLRIARVAHDIAVYASGRAADYALDEALAKWVKRTEREPLAEALRREAERFAKGGDRHDRPAYRALYAVTRAAHAQNADCTPDRCTIAAFHSPCAFQTARYARGTVRVVK